jgi:Importin-beta N-terminal domain
MEERVSQVKSALDAVYNGSGADHKRADKWLQHFQTTPEAWQVADALLMLPEAELQVLFFGAMTIHSKIRLDFHELPPDSIPSLKASLSTHLTRWATAKDMRPAVVTRLCLALAALAVQTNWTGAVQELSGAIMTSPQLDHQGRAARSALRQSCMRAHVCVWAMQQKTSATRRWLGCHERRNMRRRWRATSWQLERRDTRSGA